MTDTTTDPNLAAQLRQLKIILAAILAAIILAAAGWGIASSRSGNWSDSTCLRRSLSGSGYDRADLADHGCFG